jgi:hypothetical protein
LSESVVDDEGRSAGEVEGRDKADLRVADVEEGFKGGDEGRQRL